MPVMQVVVRWDSALPVKEALLRSNPPAEATHENVEPSYVVSVIGLRMMGQGQGRGREHDQQNGQAQDRPRRDPSEMREELLARTKLTVKGRDPITPSDVKMEAKDGENELHFFFSKINPPISRDDKEIVFEAQMGSMKITQKFHPKEMAYKGKLEL